MSPESSVTAPHYAVTIAADPTPVQVLINGWLSQKRSANTRRAYAHELRRMFDGIEHGEDDLRAITALDLIGYVDALKATVVDAGTDSEHQLKPATIARAVAAVRSFFTFVVHKVGYMQLNPAAVLTAPSVSTDLAQRILPDYAVKYIIDKTTGREHAMFLTLYTTGVRVAELCGMKWRDVRERADGRGQVTVTGKGNKTRTILLERRTWAALRHLRPADASPTDPVFRSRRGGHLSTTQAFRLIQEEVQNVRRIALVEGQAYIADAIPARGVSPHWFRHAHASHALDNRCPIHVLQSTLGHSSIAITSRYLHVNPDSSSADYIYTDKADTVAA